MAFYECAGLTAVIIPNSIIEIGPSAFMNCTRLSDVSLGDSLNDIQEDTFKGCTSLISIIIPETITRIRKDAFRDTGWYNQQNDGVLYLSNCCLGYKGSLVGDLHLEEHTRLIADEAFINCGSLSGSLVIPNTVKHIGESAFSHSYHQLPPYFTSLQLGDSLITIGDNAFCDCMSFTGDLIIPNTVTKIGQGAFFYCNGFTGSLVLPDSLTTVGNSAFYGCASLTGNLLIPETLASIGHGAFQECTGLTSVNVLNATISDRMFWDCSNLMSVIIGDSVSYIGGGAFGNNLALTTVTIPGSVQYIGDNAFVNCTSLKAMYYNAVNCETYRTWLEGCSALEMLDVGNNVQLIPDHSFINCVGLRNIVLPESVNSVGSFAFKGCVGLESIVLPESVANIGAHAFEDCLALTSADIPCFVTTIGDNAFNNCHNLTSVVIPTTLSFLGSSSFGNCSKLTNIYYQAEQLESGTSPFDGCLSLATIYVAPSVLKIGSEVFKGCQTVHFIVSLGDIPAALEAGAFSDFANSSVLMVSCGNRLAYYSVWNMFSYYSIIEDCNTYGITIVEIGSGGSITPSVQTAQMGQVVRLTVMPNQGMYLSSLKVFNANDPSQIIPVSLVGIGTSSYQFTMPPFEVVVNATFSPNTSVDESVVTPVLASVYPNPTTGNVKIEAEGLQFISIFNTLGQLIYDSSVKGDVFECDLDCYETGIYFIRVETTIGITTKKILLRR